MAQTELSNLREGQPHPTLEALVFCGFTDKGTERWRTEEEIEADVLYQKKYFIKNASKATLKKAAERKAAGVTYDKQADRLLNMYSACGITEKKFKSLNKNVRRRLLKAQPDIVITDVADREARMESVLADLVSNNNAAALEAKAKMEAKMASVRALRKTLESTSALSDECFRVKAENKPLTQDDLNQMSNSRYELPEDLTQVLGA